MRRQVFPTQKVMEIRNTCNGRISRSNWMRCPDTFNLHCKWETHNCYYFITCYQQQNTIGHVCHIAHPHIVRRVCCDIVCPTWMEQWRNYTLTDMILYNLKVVEYVEWRISEHVNMRLNPFNLIFFLKNQFLFKWDHLYRLRESFVTLFVRMSQPNVMAVWFV